MATKSLAAQGMSDSELSEFVQHLLEKWHVPGISIAVVDGKNGWAEAFGVAEFPSTSFAPETLSYAGSTTKAHVAVLLALLIDSKQYNDDQGQPLSWSTTISSLIQDDFVLQDEWATNHVTLEDAICHRTGIAKHDNAYIRYVRPDGFRGLKQLITLREMVRGLRHLPMGSSPRTSFCYSNLMFATLSHVIETLTGQWLGDALRTWVWKPLGMEQTYFSLDEAMASGYNVARGYFWDSEKQEYYPFERMPTEEVSGSGAVITSATDLAKWLRFWISEQGPLSAAGHQSIRRPHIPVDEGHNPAPFDTPMMYAKAWQTSSYHGHRFWTHHGGMDAFGAQVTFCPDLEFGIAIMGNTAFTTNAVAEMITWKMIDAKICLPEIQRFDWNTKWENAVRQIRENVRNGLNTVYPNRPASPFPPSLPLEKYAGIYYHPAYKYLHLQLVESSAKTATVAEYQGQLYSELVDNNFRVVCNFKHVSADNWIMYVDLMDAPTLTMHGFGAVSFRVGTDGNVQSIGIEWRARSNVEGWIWYERLV